MRVDRKVLNKPDAYWAHSVAQEVIARFPDQEEYILSSGISPSGAVHFGNLREIMTQYTVKLELEKLGKSARLIFVWDDFDAMRKIPAGTDPAWEEHLRKPLSAVPDPSGEFPSWGKRYQVQFEKDLQDLGIDIDFRYQTEMYGSGAYDESIKKGLQQRDVIADILLEHMSDKAKAAKEINEDEYKANYYPISVFSTFTGKDATEILSYNGETEITYRCKITGNEETIDFTKQHIVKFDWKPDWAMRWQDMGVRFESAGKDHNSPGGAFDVSSEIVRRVFGGEPPVTTTYEFIGIRGLGAKMSGSKGNSMTAGQLLEIYERPLLLWLYFRKLPYQRFDLSFDSELLRQYTELDREVVKLRAGELGEADAEALRLAGAEEMPENPIPFRQAIAFGQIVQWDVEKVVHMLESLDMEYDRASIETRLRLAKNYLEKHHPEEVVALLDAQNTEHWGEMDEARRALVGKLTQVLEGGEDDIAKLEVLMYDIPKRDDMEEDEKKKAQRAFFTDVYRLLIGKKAGPRLSTFLWAIDRKRAIELLSL